MYFVGTPMGAYNSSNSPDHVGWGSWVHNMFLQDLDQPSKQPLQMANTDRAANGEGTAVAFKNHNFRRFSYTEINVSIPDTPARIIEEIVMPDAQ